MFSKASKQASANTNDSARSAPRSSVPSIISADLRINGDLICSGDVQVDGWVEGDIQSRNIVIGEGATVQGGLQAETVRVCGVVNGQIKGTWKRTLRSDVMMLETQFFTPLPNAESRAVAVAIRRYGEFLQLPVASA